MIILAPEVEVGPPPTAVVPLLAALTLLPPEEKQSTTIFLRLPRKVEKDTEPDVGNPSSKGQDTPLPVLLMTTLKGPR